MKTTFTGKSRLSGLLCLAGLLSFLFAVPQARADENDAKEPGDPPSRVARISYVDGTVSLQPGGNGDWGAAAKNRPVTIGDKIWADKDSRVELQAGQAAIHLGSMTALSFLNLDESITQMRLAEGSVNFRVRELREGDVYEVDTPNLAFTVKEAGAFRIDVNENGDGTRVTVIRGEGEVAAGGKSYPVHAGERGEFNGTGDAIEFTTSSASEPDGLDRWASDRDTKEENSVSAKYVSRDTVGYSDLDDYGSWSEVPDYGHVWYPTVVEAGWAPYSYGYWNWVGPWGWTWVDYSPWGFAPFHYGRWGFIGGRWGWCPGPIFARPIYGPAFVGFFGGRHFGVGFGFGGGFGGVGWFPLGFGEPFHPWFHCGDRFVRNINVHNTVIRNTTIINNNHFNYSYAHNVNAVTVASHNTFVNGQAVNRNAVHVTEASLRGAQVTNKVGLNPTRQSSFGAVNTGAHVTTPSTAVQNRSVMARTTPASSVAHSQVRTMNTANLTAGRPGNSSAGNFANRPSVSANAGAANSAAMTARQNQLNQNRPPSAAQNSARSNGGFANNNMSQRPQNNTSAPRTMGSTNGAANRPAQTTRMNSNDRPSWARSGGSGNATMNGSVASRPSSPSMNSNRPPYSNSNSGRSYTPPQRSTPSYNGGYSQQRSYSPPSRSYSAPSHNYSAPSHNYSAPPRTYSAPSRSYPAPSHSYSAPSGGGYRGGGSSGGYRGGGGGGGGSRGGGGGSVSHGRH